MIEPDFNLAELAKAAGATFVARCTTFHAQMLSDLSLKAFSIKASALSKQYLPARFPSDARTKWAALPNDDVAARPRRSGCSLG